MRQRIRHAAGERIDMAAAQRHHRGLPAGEMHGGEFRAAHALQHVTPCSMSVVVCGVASNPLSLTVSRPGAARPASTKSRKLR
jgi:hypothetical protein